MIVKNKTRYQQLEAILKSLGWYKNRSSNIEDFKHLAKTYHCNWTKAISIFCKSYVNLDNDCIYLGFDEDTTAKFDFIIRFTVSESKKCYNSPDFKKISRFSREPLLCIGEFGYYYPGVMAIGESGTLYVAHDYNDIVKTFDNLIEAIDAELSNKTISIIKLEKTVKLTP